MSTTANNDENQKAPYTKEIETGDLVSIPFGGKFIQGIVKEISPENFVIDSKAEGSVKIPNTKDVYKFFPGQKFDFREFYKNDPNNKDNHSVIQKLDKFLAKTSVGSFKNLQETNRGEIVQLLTGKLTNNLVHGSSLVNPTDENGKVIANQPKEMKNWSAKINIFRGNDGHLKVDNVFKNEKELNLKVYNIEVTPEQKASLVEKGESVTLTRNRKDETQFKVFAKYDKDLNKIVTFPYSEKVEIKMKESYAKKEGVGAAPEKKENIFTKKLAENKAKEKQAEKPSTKKGPKR